ncbi:MAG: response regulator [Pirellulaceae bacterium]|jgi:putative two-component system response regulator|nr:response regulator [Pirellulaceae bacterium]
MTDGVTSTPEPLAASATHQLDIALQLVAEAASADGLPSLSRDTTKCAKIMIVDDEPINIKVVQKYLAGHGYSNFCTTTDATQAVELFHSEQPDIALLDIMMPEVSGIEILQHVRTDRQLAHIPVVILTAVGDARIKRKALELGATDFLTKPVDPSELVLRVGNALMVKAHYDHLANYSVQLERQVRLRTAELMASRRSLVQTLARAAEYRDNETAHHIMRVGRYVGIIARELGMSAEIAELLEEASLLHDVGKIGIADAILLKPGALTCGEFENMKRHCDYGRRIIQQLPEHGQADSSVRSQLEHIEPGNATAWLVPVAASIAQTHHEHWDGTGYPLGLRGEQIPIEGRITAVADVFDALSDRRPYKEPYPFHQCLEMMEELRGTQFDPQVLSAFLRRTDDILQVQIDLADAD